MKIIETCTELAAFVSGVMSSGKSIGAVPTMGALHEGHLSLVDASLESSDVTIVTIFVNPTQFALNEDLDAYPRTLQDDLKSLRDRAVDAVFCPSVVEMYPEGFSTTINPPAVSQRLEGTSRPTHFSGVATVVLKLLNLTRCDKAFFGQKDFQQTRVISAIVGDLNLSTEIVVCPIARDADGLALSSRNRYLAVDERYSAISISRALSVARQMVDRGVRDVVLIEQAMHREMIEGSVDSIEYAVVVDSKDLRPLKEIPTDSSVRPIALIAAKVGSTRLIDNRFLADRPTRRSRM